MRTRNADSSSKSATNKKTPPARKAAAKTAGEFPSTKRTSAAKTRQIKKKDASTASNPIPDSNPEKSPDELKSCEAATATDSSKKRAPGRPRKAVATPNLVEQSEAVTDETAVVDDCGQAEKLEEPRDVEVVDARNTDCEKVGEQFVGCIGQSHEKEQKRMEVDGPIVEKVCELADKGKNAVEFEVTASQDTSSSFKQPGCTLVDLNISVDDEDAIDATKGERGEEGLKEQEGEKGDGDMKEREGEKREELKEQDGDKGGEELKEWEGEKGQELKEQVGENKKEELKELDNNRGEEALNNLERDKRKEEFKQEREKGKEESKEDETNVIRHIEDSNILSSNADVKDHLQKDVNPRKHSDQGTNSSSKLNLGEQGGEDHIEEDREEDPEETEAREEEHMELEAIAKRRKIKKEHEIFVGGLDRDAMEEDLRKVFQRIGEVVEVRLHKNSSTNKNKGYAFVKFANKEHAKKALSEMKNPVIRGKRCGTAPSEDNDTLFLGNICNTWTKEAIKRKLKDYGIEEIENITLVPDVQHEGLSRGFAFLEFSCHADAMVAYKRLQKPDAIFGHSERSAKVAFAEPMHEPDPDIMAQVKSVFVNGISPEWDEDYVKELFKFYGEIVRIVLARNMPTAKRKDYGFVDFSTHEAAVACVEGVNKSDLSDGTSKIKLTARLSNPLPKTQAVKGGMCGGFRIGHTHTRSGAFARSGRGFGRGRQHFNNWGNIKRDRNVYRGGHRQIGRMGFQNEPDLNMYPDFHHRQFGPQGVVRGGHYPHSRGAAFPGSYRDTEWCGIPAEGPSEPFPSRRPYSPDGQFHRPYMGIHFDDLYFYDENVRGVKRPFYMTDPDPDYMGPNRLHPRLDYPDPSLFHENRYPGSFGAGSRQYPHDYYGSEYGGGPYSSFYGGDSLHGRGHYN